MAKRASSTRTSSRQTSAPKTASVFERRLATPRADLLLIKVGGQNGKRAASANERAPRVLKEVVKLMTKPGTDRASIFKSVSGKPVYAYSIDPRDTTMLVREDSAGHKTVGRLVSGRFRSLSSAKKT